jgi:hypothetical protein
MMPKLTVIEQVENQMVSEFKEEFFKTMGYYPVVVTKQNVNDEEHVPLMTLDKLQEYFEPFLPVIHDIKYSLKTKRRFREIVVLRMMFVFIAKKWGYSYTRIAKFLNYADHTTPIHAYQMFVDIYSVDVSFREHYQQVVNHIKKQHDNAQLMAELDKISGKS